eukprot:143081-Lingulodinium_polyedra.AAC.1
MCFCEAHHNLVSRAFKILFADTATFKNIKPSGGELVAAAIDLAAGVNHDYKILNDHQKQRADEWLKRHDFLRNIMTLCIVLTGQAATTQRMLETISLKWERQQQYNLMKTGVRKYKMLLKKRQ